MGRVPASLLLHLLSESPYAHVCTRARTHVGEVHARVRRNGVASSSAPTATISLYYARIHGGQDRKRQLMHGTQHLIRYAARGGSWRTARRGVELSPPDDTISRGSINLYHRYPNNLWSNGRKSGSLSHLQRDKTRDAYFSFLSIVSATRNSPPMELDVADAPDGPAGRFAFGEGRGTTPPINRAMPTDWKSAGLRVDLDPANSALFLSRPFVSSFPTCRRIQTPRHYPLAAHTRAPRWFTVLRRYGSLMSY